MKEEWKVIDDFANYQVSSLGRVKNITTSKLLKAYNNGLGYMAVSLSSNGKSKRFYVHRLVASAFTSNPDNKPDVNHLDGQKDNNHVSNLEWVTPSENMAHAIATGLSTYKHVRGRNKPLNRNGRPVVAYMGDVMHIFKSLSEAKRELGADPSNVTECAIGGGRYHTVKGHYWRFI